MSSGIVPERQPVGDTLTGCVIQTAKGHKALALTPHEGAETLYTGPLIVRYGVRYLEKSHLSIVPGLIALDYGDIVTGEEAWAFLLRRSNLHPRADIFGFRNDGKDEMIAVKRLDLARDFEVLVYTDTQPNLPIASVEALIASEKDQIAERILQYLPRYDTIAIWQARL